MNSLAGDAWLAVAQRIPPPQVDRIDAQRHGDHVDVTLAGKHGLRVAGARIDPPGMLLV